MVFKRDTVNSKNYQKSTSKDESVVFSAVLNSDNRFELSGSGNLKIINFVWP